MIQNNVSEKGQVLILISLAAVMLFAFAGLAIDGSAVFSDKRHAQNAADTSAMAAALAKLRGQSFSSAAMNRAISNGYDNNGVTNNVNVYNPPIDGLYVGDSEYIQVKITSHVKTYFARVIGRNQVTNRVEAVTHAVPGYSSSLFAGSAIVGLDPSGCKAVFFNGNANMTLTGSGIYVNSNCALNAFYNQSSSPGILTTPCLQTVGGAQFTFGKVINTQAGCPRTNVPPMSSPPLPNISCGTLQAKVQPDNITLSPGNWVGAFPPNGITYLQPGTYCVSGGAFQINGGSTLIGHDVTIYMIDGTVKWNGGAKVQLDAPDSGEFAGLLLYLPPTNTNSVTINGNGDSHIVGTIFAPASDVTVEGGGGATGLECQIIGFHVNLSGSSDTKIDFKANLNYQPPTPPAIEFTQ
jgi:hypothetical protein